MTLVIPDTIEQQPQMHHLFSEPMNFYLSYKVVFPLMQVDDGINQKFKICTYYYHTKVCVDAT